MKYETDLFDLDIQLNWSIVCENVSARVVAKQGVIFRYSMQNCKVLCAVLEMY